MTCRLIYSKDESTSVLSISVICAFDFYSFSNRSILMIIYLSKIAQVVQQITFSMIPTYKIVVLGQGRVGKTSLSVKYVKNEFNDKQKETINASYLQKKVKVEKGDTVKLSIWDTAGQEEYNSVASIYYKDAVAAIIVYDITFKESFEKVKKWVEELKMNAPEGLILTFAGNKADLENNRTVKKEDVEAFAKKHSATHFTVSAKNGTRINQMFQDLAERIFAVSAGSKSSSKRGGPKLTLDKGNGREKSKQKGCC